MEIHFERPYGAEEGTRMCAFDGEVQRAGAGEILCMSSPLLWGRQELEKGPELGGRVQGEELTLPVPAANTQWDGQGGLSQGQVDLGKGKHQDVWPSFPCPLSTTSTLVPTPEAETMYSTHGLPDV